MTRKRFMVLMAAAAAVLLGQSSGLTISGDIAAKLVLSPADFAKMPRQEVSFDSHGTELKYQGVALRLILERAGVALGKDLRGKNLAAYVLAKARDGYQVVFSLGELGEEFGNETVVIADRVDGKPLPDDQGPLRLVVDGDKEGARSVRMLETLEVVKLRK